MRFDDGADDRKSHAHAQRLCRENGSKTFLRSPAAIPGPVSPIRTSALVPDRRVVTLISRLFASAPAIASIALIIRFRKPYPLDLAAIILHIHSFHARKLPGDGVVIDHLQEELDI